ncbi:MAG: hypothetical protein KDC42_05725 [Ignavibacteriae bacterium]|nr:hypothetical protein [Ignavibacteriota bacterium]
MQNITTFTGILVLGLISLSLWSCNSENVITQIFSNEITAKDRLDSANAQSKRDYGDTTDMVMIYGRNVTVEGKTDLTALTILTSGNLDSIGTWVYVYKSGSTSSFRLYAPDPIPGQTDCVNLTQFFNPLDLLSLISDTSAANIIRGALDLIISSNIKITTPPGLLIDSDQALQLANTESQIIKFNSSFTPSISSTNGNIFFQTGTNKKINVFLIPAAGTLNLPVYITQLVSFPADLWIVNYTKTNTSGQTENMVLATVVQSNQSMGLTSIPGFSSRVINLSKFFSN